MDKKYAEFNHLDLTTFAGEILKFWEKEHIFEKSISNREGKTPFVFYEGPPSANGMPGIHHVISRTLKDLVCRYKTMQGFQVNRKGGWDTHGLPVELGVEKSLGISKEDIGKKISVEEYNATCRREVLKFKDKWDELTRKMGYWVDLKHPYITFENNYIETLWWCLKRLYDKGFLYKSVSIQPYSPAAGTGLSSHELNQPGTYKDVRDTSIVAIFSVVRNQKSEFLFEKVNEGVSFLAWTTTPWTLPSNLGLTVGEKIEYSLVSTLNPYTHEKINVVLATQLIPSYFRPEGENRELEEDSSKKIIPWKQVMTFPGEKLVGISYVQLLPSEANSMEKIRESDPEANPFKVIAGDFVTTEDGTGIVHTAPAFGADDFRVGKKNHLGILVLVDKRGKFIDGVGEFSGRYVKDYWDEKDYQDVNVDISVKLKKEGKAFRIEKYEHNYPHCWRTDKPVIYYPLDAWFIRTTAVKDRMIELNKTIHWKPESTGTGRFGNWLENMVDWNLSRSRFWGTPLPIWQTEDAEEEICIGSVDDLKKEIRKSIEKKAMKVPSAFENNPETFIEKLTSDLHKPFVDDIILVSPSGKPMKRIPDLVDVWFDSGSMPYAQWHYPFENQEIFSKNFPADFIAEGVDQTRGWFYTLHALGVLLFDSVAYKTVVSNGLVLDKNGNKMSKRVGNVVDPFRTLETFGPDATRWYLITNASPWDSLRFDTEGIKEVQRKFFGTLYNTYQFFALYANVDKFYNEEDPIPVNQRPELDRWVLSVLNTLIKEVNIQMDAYEPTQAARAIDSFVNDQLSNWYVRLCRRRFWKPAGKENGKIKEHDLKDKISAYQTLLECLVTVSKLMAPLAPFFADWLFRNLNEAIRIEDKLSVHLADFPESDKLKIDEDLEKRMKLAQDISSLILSLRKKVNIKVRQPLQRVLIPSAGKEFDERLRPVIPIIRSETNVKEVDILPADNDFIRKKAKANYKTLGKRLGAKMKWAANAIQSLTADQIDQAVAGKLLLNPDPEKSQEEPIYITSEDIEIMTEEIQGYEIAVKGPMTVALDIELSDDLKNEGYSRELVNRVQNLRKEKNLEVTDKIVLIMEDKGLLKNIISDYNDYICAEILARQIDFVPKLTEGEQIEVNNDVLTVQIKKIS